MSGSSRARAALAIAVVLTTGVALATPVPVLAVSDGGREVVAPLAEGEALTYSYRQSIYDVAVFEEFARRGDIIELLRVRSPDIRSIEYFRWDGTIQQDYEGNWIEDAPPSEHSELVIRIAPLGRQRLSTARWSIDLLPRFGENVVTVRITRRPVALTWIAAP